MRFFNVKKLEDLYKIFEDHSVISTDSRKITKGSIFFALKGENFNGENFAEDALKAGASYAVVSKSINVANERFIVVDNVLNTLQQLANYHRKKIKVKILSITGSNGKTTTKELCKSILSKKYNVLATGGNLNNHIGVPLTLLSIKSNTDIGIIEMGANHPGEIKQLCEIAAPDFGLITNIGKAHLEGFGSIEGVARAKGEMFEYLLKNNGIVFLNEGNIYLNGLVNKEYKSKVSYNNNIFSGEVISFNPFLTAKLNLKGEEILVNTNLVGRYNLENVLAAATVGFHFKVPASDIKNAIEGYVPDNNRSQLIDTGKNKIILDAYNANPSSMRNAIENFFDLEEKNKVVIIGQMLELGDASETEHKAIADLFKNKNVVRIILIGKAFEKYALDEGYEYYENTDKILQKIENKPILGATILIKGSRGNQLEKIMPYL